MRRFKCPSYASAAVAVAAFGLFSGADLAGAPGDQPVYIYLVAKVTDHVNLDLSEDRLRHILPEVERYRLAHPQAPPSATILFSGAVSKALQQRDGQTHIVDFVKDYIRRGVIEAGYDGTDEPTYDHRPTLKIQNEPSPEARWKARQAIADQFLAEARDPLTGAPASGTGGLKAMQEVFGPAAYITGLDLASESYRPPLKVTPPAEAPGAPPPGASFAAVLGVFRELGGDTETLQMLRKYNTTALMSGAPAANPAQLPGYREAITHLGWIMSPAPETGPELYWQDYVLRISEAAPPVHAVKASDGVDGLKDVLDKAKRSTVHLVQVELGGPENYLQAAFAKTAPNAPLKNAYDHPQAPRLAADMLRPTAETDAGWVKEEALLKWLTEAYFPSNAGSRFVSSSDLSKMAGSSTGYSISTAALRSELSDALKKVGNDTHLFDYLRVDGHYLSLAELFQVLTDELAEFRRTGKLPESVKTAKVYGPFRLVTGHGPNEGQVTAGDLEAACAEIAGALHQDALNPSNGVPVNSVPPLLKINGMDLNPAQMIRLMALALASPAPATKLPVRMAYMTGEAGAVVPKTRPLFDTGFVWTLKPAPLALTQ
ncbi:MAG: hypothetical protein LAO55_09490 [Acidobacteriia bacterium]|nr:hypothetical protein [Terriglobia bacterium]